MPIHKEMKTVLETIYSIKPEDVEKEQVYHLNQLKTILMDIYGVQLDKKIYPILTYLKTKGIVIVTNEKRKIMKIDFERLAEDLKSE